MSNLVLVCVTEGAATDALLNVAMTLLGCFAAGILGLVSARFIAGIGSDVAT